MSTVEMAVKAVGGIVIAIAAVIVVGIAADFYLEHRMASFCNAIPLQAPVSDVFARAGSSGYWVPDSDKGPDRKDLVMVFNHKAPMWRKACLIYVRDDKVVDRKSIYAD